MTTSTDTQLKLALAKMLPEDVEICHDYLMWKRQPTKFHIGPAEHYQIVLDTELLHLCWLVEETLMFEDRVKCAKLVYQQDGFFSPADSDGTTEYDELFNYIHATWQQRTIALAKVKGVDL